jgi:hypothetical protein
MDLSELKQRVLALPGNERHEFVVWINRLESNYSNVPAEALNKVAAEIWDEDDRRAAPTHPPR